VTRISREIGANGRPDGRKKTWCLRRLLLVDLWKPLITAIMHWHWLRPVGRVFGSFPGRIFSAQPERVSVTYAVVGSFFPTDTPRRCVRVRDERLCPAVSRSAATESRALWLVVARDGQLMNGSPVVTWTLTSRWRHVRDRLATTRHRRCRRCRCRPDVVVHRQMSVSVCLSGTLSIYAQRFPRFCTWKRVCRGGLGVAVRGGRERRDVTCTRQCRDVWNKCAPWRHHVIDSWPTGSANLTLAVCESGRWSIDGIMTRRRRLRRWCC